MVSGCTTSWFLLFESTMIQVALSHSYHLWGRCLHWFTVEIHVCDSASAHCKQHREDICWATPYGHRLGGQDTGDAKRGLARASVPNALWLLMLNATYSFCTRSSLYSSLLICWLIAYSTSLHLAEKCYYTVYTQVSQRMKQQTNGDTEHITNVIRRWKWGKR